MERHAWEQGEPKPEPDPRRVAFVAHLRLVVVAMHDIEWVDSCDYGPGDDGKAIEAVFADTGPARTGAKGGPDAE